MGIIDLHIHILPGLDDGACDMDEALEMAVCAMENGMEAVAATSHSRMHSQKPRLETEKYFSVLSQFRKELRSRNIPLEVFSGMEVMADHSTIESLWKHSLLTINETRYVLVETPFDIPGNQISEILGELQRSGYSPILAHPERYFCVKSNPMLLEEWKKNRIVLQVNKGSLLGEFGQKTKQTADWMLRRRLAGLVATDAHDTALRTVELDDLLDWMEFEYGYGSIELLMEENPRRILDGMWIGQ